MEEDKRHTDPLDEFSMFVKNRLSNHRLPTEESSWKEMETLLPKEQSNKYIWLLTTGLVAAIALLLILLLPDVEKLPGLSVEQAENIPEKEQLSQETIPTFIGSIPLISEDRNIQQRKGVDNTFIAEKIIVEEIIQVMDSIEVNVSETEKEGPDQYGEVIRLPETKEGHLFVDPVYWKTHSKRNKKGQLGGYIGTGGSVGISGFGNDLVYDAGQSEDNLNSKPPPPPVRPPFLTTPDPDNYNEVNYLPPFSFGLTTRFYLNHSIGIEAGLVYTFLVTKMNGMYFSPVEARLVNHYLGLPVSVVANVWNQSRWNIYFSLGGMIEKGLQSVYKVKEYPASWEITTTIKSHIEGIQWSLQATAGISYRVYKDWSIYIEPRLSYYFDNDQPASIRTEHPWVVGIGAGMRFDF